MALATPYLEAIKRFEGWTPRATWDYRQNSNGYGTRARYPGEVIDRAEGERRFSSEIGQAAQQVAGMGVAMTPGQAAALTDLTYNAGPGWMNAGLGAAVRAGNWDDARSRFLQYVNAGGKPLPGLINRRQQTAQWMTADGQPSLPQVTQPQAEGNTMPLMGAAPQQMPQQQQSGFDLRSILTSPLFLMGAGVLGAPNIGQGLMTGAQAAERIRSGDLNRQLQERQLSMQQQAHNARMAQMNDPLARQQREADLALTQARTAELGNPYKTQLQQQQVQLGQSQLDAAKEMAPLKRDIATVQRDTAKFKLDVLRQQANGPNIISDPAKRAAAEATLRKELTARTQDYRSLRDAARTINAVAQKPSPAGDLSLIFAYMKVLDPTSVVRESEQASASNAAGVPDRIRNLWNRMLMGYKLSEAQRADFIAQAQTLAEQKRRGFDADIRDYTAIAQRLGLDPTNIAIGQDPIEPGKTTRRQSGAVGSQPSPGALQPMPVPASGHPNPNFDPASRPDDPLGILRK